MTVSTYTPGQWIAVVSGPNIALLPPDTGSVVVAQIWANATEGRDLTSQLQVLLGGGIAALGPFALVSLDAGRVHAIVRGGVEVQFETASGNRVLGAADVSTWAEENVADASAVTVRSPGHVLASGAHGLPVVAAVVRAGAVRTVLSLAVGDRGPMISAAPAWRATPPVLDAGPVPSAEPVLIAEPVADLGDLEHTVLKPEHTKPEHPKPATPAEPAPTKAAGKPTVSHRAAAPEPPAITHALVVAPVLTGPPPAREPAAAGPGTEDHDGLTTLSADVDAIRRRLPAWSGDLVGPPVAAATPRKPPPRLVLSSGLVLALSRPVLLGRAPAVSRVANREIPRLVTVASPNQDISRTHAEVRLDGDDVLVTDLLSTNGVLLRRPGAGPLRLHPGEPTVIDPGVVVDLGEGISFTLERGE